jgi:hypothetical protein
MGEPFGKATALTGWMPPSLTPVQPAGEACGAGLSLT